MEADDSGDGGVLRQGKQRRRPTPEPPATVALEGSSSGRSSLRRTWASPLVAVHRGNAFAAFTLCSAPCEFPRTAQGSADSNFNDNNNSDNKHDDDGSNNNENNDDNNKSTNSTTNTNDNNNDNNNNVGTKNSNENNRTNTTNENDTNNSSSTNSSSSNNNGSIKESIFLLNIRKEVSETLMFGVVCSVLLCIACYLRGFVYTPWQDVIGYCVVYSLWITLCLPWLLINLDGKTLGLLCGVLFRLLAADLGVLVWGAIRGETHILQRSLRLKPLMEPSLSWLSDAGYSLRFGVLVASVTASLTKVVIDWARIASNNHPPKRQSPSPPPVVELVDSEITSPVESVSSSPKRSVVRQPKLHTSQRAIYLKDCRSRRATQTRADDKKTEKSMKKKKKSRWRSTGQTVNNASLKDASSPEEKFRESSAVCNRFKQNSPNDSSSPEGRFRGSPVGDRSKQKSPNEKSSPEFRSRESPPYNTAQTSPSDKSSPEGRFRGSPPENRFKQNSPSDKSSSPEGRFRGNPTGNRFKQPSSNKNTLRQQPSMQHARIPTEAAAGVSRVGRSSFLQQSAGPTARSYLDNMVKRKTLRTTTAATPPTTTTVPHATARSSKNAESLPPWL